MRKRQLKRLEAKHEKMAVKIDKANEFLGNINSLKEAMKVLKNNPNAYVSVAVISNNTIIPLSDCVNFSQDLWCEILQDSKKDLEKQFKAL